jgi:S-DNA-T family DNA segregation ATPase FtsK/SpoIIIE
VSKIQVAMAARRRTRRRRRSRGFLPAVRLPVLSQRQLDLLGLALLAFAALFAFILYFGWDGGQVGEAMADGFRYLLGDVAYAVPLVLLGGGAATILRPMLPSVRPFRAGAACLICALALGLASGSLGLGPGDTPRDGFLDASYLERHGGLFGDSLYVAAKTLFQEVGAHILFAFLAIAGVLLITGGSIAGVIAATGRRVATTTARVRGGAAAPLPEAARPPEVEPVVRATHVEAPALDGVERYPDLFDGDPEPEQEQPAVDPDWGPEAEEDQPEPEPEIDEEPVADDEPLPERLTPMGNRRSAVTEADDVAYKLPRATILKRAKSPQKLDAQGIEKMGVQLVQALAHFKVDAKVIGTVTGPHVTRYELRLAPGIKMAKVSQLRDDLAYALAAEHVRILAPVPGKQAVGVEVPNRVRSMVHLGDVMRDTPEGYSPLTVWLGKDIAGQAIGTDLAKQPHVLVAGTTGSGKSGAVNAMLSSILLRATPNEVRMVLVDPKRVELNHYEHIPHLLTPVVTSPRLAANVLGNLVKEMEERYGVMSAARTRDLVTLNKHRVANGERPLPYILCVIDELADLMMVAPAEVEDSIIRIAQKARAVGIHLVLATQRPSADIITGMIKANVPTRIAFAVSSQTDSRVILDQNGAETLLGKGDMLFLPSGQSKLKRIQGAFIDEDEILALTDHWRRQGEPELQEELLEALEEPEGGGDDDFDPDQDDLLPDAIQTVVQMGTASTSMLQRRLRVGYTRAGRLVDMMERRGVISGYEGSKARQVLITEADLPRVLEALAEAPVAAAQDE